MTPEERQAAFIEAYNKLTAQFGLSFAAQVQPRQLGPVVQIEPALVLIAVEGWTPPVAETNKEIAAP